MATITAPALNTYFTRDPAQVAQEKYSNQTWNERYAYISMVAFIALAVVANIFLNPLFTTTVELLLFNTGVLSVASNLVLPQVMEWFAQAKKLKAQGDKEIQISAKVQQLRAMNAGALAQLFANHGVNVPALPLEQSTLLLARMSCKENQAADLRGTVDGLVRENKFREAYATRVAIAKAKAKSGYFAYLLQNPTRQEKFKDSFEWSTIPLEDRAFAAALESEEPHRLAQTRGPAPRFFELTDLADGDNVADRIRALLVPQPAMPLPPR